MCEGEEKGAYLRTIAFIAVMADPRERERELGYPRPGKKEEFAPPWISHSS